MKKQFTITSFAFLLGAIFNSNAQLVTISATHQLPAAGDTVHYVNANSFGFDPVGTGPVTNKLWDESALITSGTYNFFYVDPSTIVGSGVSNFPTANIARGESGATGYFYYNNTSSNLNRVGWYGSASNYGIYENGLVATEFHFPFTAGDMYNSSYSGQYSPLGVGEDSVRIEQGSLSMTADMQGTLILPTGTFTNVLRIHVLEEFLLVPYIQGFPALNFPVQDDYYYWFVDTVLQPIMVSGQTTVNGSSQSPVLRYQPLSSPTGIANQDVASLSIYPNPSNGKFTIKNSGSLNYNLEIYNTLGAKVHFTQVNPHTLAQVDLSAYPAGIYSIKMISGKNIHTEKIVIQ